MREILNHIAQLAQDQRAAVLCTLVETRGSTPQKAGASMLVLPDSTQFGTLGGGCVEAEVKRRALAAIGSSQPELLTFNLDDNYGWDDGLICGGRMRVLAEPVATDIYQQYFRTLHHLLKEGHGCIEAVSISDDNPIFPSGSRILFGDSTSPLTQLRCSPDQPRVIEKLPDLKKRPRPTHANGIAYIPYLPRPVLLIIGAGHVGQAVAELASQSDFTVHVMDDRSEYANADRFPSAKQITVADVETGCQDILTNEHTYCIVVTRGHAHDEQALFHMIQKPTAYLGMIGSKRKIRLIFEDLVADGIPEADLERVHAPLGLNIGSQTVPEIAISIVAELIAFRNLGYSPEHYRRQNLNESEKCLAKP